MRRVVRERVRLQYMQQNGHQAGSLDEKFISAFEMGHCVIGRNEENSSANLETRRQMLI
jgi:hypothetical protein